MYFTRDKQSERRHTLRVLDVDPLSEPAGRTPLLDLKQRSIWRKAPFGLDQFGRKVAFCLMWVSLLIGAQPRRGKALALDTLVPTPTGWTTMGELQAGDEVFDEQGNPCRVLEAHPIRHDRPCYEVHFSDGSVIVADAEHLWQLDTRASRLGAQQRAAREGKNNSLSRDQSARWALPKVLTTADMLDSVRIQAEGRANYSVRVAAPLQADDASLPVPPYTLGAWLGDGTTIFGTITTMDPEIVAAIEAEGERAGLIPSTVAAGKCPGYRIYGLQPRLRQIEVLGNKHIPVAYLRASEAQRRALLAGLLDTDGYCQPSGVVYFAVTSERLARDTRQLVSTLGYKSTLTVKPVKFEGRDHGWQWIVTFTPGDKVFGLARKACRQVTKTKASAAHRFITEIRPVPSVPVRCITVDNPNSLYLVGETCIPTHNTFTGRQLALFCALDPYVDITIIDGKNSRDWLPFKYIAKHLIQGSHPTKDGDPVQHALDALREVDQHWQHVNEELKKLPVAECPEGKLTEKLSRRPDLHVQLLIMEEFQTYFELDDQKKNKEFANLLARIGAMGP
ncbi:MAG: LAGLIDADG family homing endonuclease, partial [Solirubrobacteraceae bacterium]